MRYISMYSFVAGFMIGALLAGIYFIGNAPISFPGSIPPFMATSTNTKPTSETSGTISVANQTSGSSVVIESVTVPPPGVWIAVREVQDINLGNVLGAAHVDGPRSAVTVSLLRATEPGKQYAVELYRNDSNEGFNPSTNSVYIDFDTSAPVIAYFTTAN